VTDAVRAAKFVVTASSLRAGVRALLGVLPPDLRARPEVVEVRARFAAHVGERARDARDGDPEAELRDLVDLAGRLATSCWSEHETSVSLGAALVRLRANVSLARCLVHRRTSIPPPMPKPPR
jgi:hypothetical protein